MSLEENLNKQSVKVEPISKMELLHRRLEEAGIKVIPAKQVEIPAHFNLSALESIHITPEILEHKLRTVIDYLRMPYLTDEFGDDQEARRAYRKEIVSEFGKLAEDEFDQNKLRAKGFGTTFMFIEMFAHKYLMADLGDEPIAKKLINLTNRLPFEVSKPDVFNTLSLADKMRVTGELSNIATEFLQLFNDTPTAKHAA